MGSVRINGTNEIRLLTPSGSVKPSRDGRVTTQERLEKLLTADESEAVNEEQDSDVETVRLLDPTDEAELI